MSTLNISLPDLLRDYVEQRATDGHYSASEYVRQLIRDDKARRTATERQMLWDYLAMSARQLDDGDIAEVTADDILVAGRARRKAAKG